MDNLELEEVMAFMTDVLMGYYDTDIEGTDDLIMSTLFTNTYGLTEDGTASKMEIIYAAVDEIEMVDGSDGYMDEEGDGIPWIW